MLHIAITTYDGILQSLSLADVVMTTRTLPLLLIEAGDGRSKHKRCLAKRSSRMRPRGSVIDTARILRAGAVQSNAQIPNQRFPWY